MTDPGESLLCSPAEKPRIEAANGVEQLDYIAYLINEYKLQEVRESHVLELHKIAGALNKLGC